MGQQKKLENIAHSFSKKFQNFQLNILLFVGTYNLTKPWGEKYKPNRVMCIVITVWPDRKVHMEKIAKTWGSACDRLHFVLSTHKKPPKMFHGANVTAVHTKYV